MAVLSKSCPRCHGDIIVRLGEAFCLQCGNRGRPEPLDKRARPLSDRVAGVSLPENRRLALAGESR